MRYLVYANELETEGRIATTSTRLKTGPREDPIRRDIAAPDEVRPNRTAHARASGRGAPVRRARLLPLACSAMLLTSAAHAAAQSLPTNQRLYDTVSTMPEVHASRIAKFEAEPVLTGRVIFLGNSITQGGDWARLTGDSTVINRGIGADLTFSLRQRLADVTRRKPSRLFILIGINDISKDIPDAVIAAEYRALVDSVHAGSPATKIFVQSILPLNPAVKNFPQHYDKQARVVAVNVLLRRMAREAGATYVNLWPAVVDARSHLDARLTADGLHLNEQGYVRWVQFLKAQHLL